MGQYFIAVLLGSAEEPYEFIRAWIASFSYQNGSKLMEHSYLGNAFMNAVEFLLSPNGHFWKTRLVWAGDYAPEEQKLRNADLANTLYDLTDCEPDKEVCPTVTTDMSNYYYIVNHTKKQYVDKRSVAADSRGFRIHPLSLLTAEGNGNGGGDYRGAHEDKVGSWARDVISVEREAPDGYCAVEFEFKEE